MSHTNLILGSNWQRGEWPGYIEVGHEDETDSKVYVPERTCRMVDCCTHDTCVVNKELGNGNFVSQEFGYKKCSGCGAYVFDCPTVRYCPGCGAMVVSE